MSCRVIDPECLAVGCGGCDEYLADYPCNCAFCQGDGEEYTAAIEARLFTGALERLLDQTKGEP